MSETIKTPTGKHIKKYWITEPPRPANEEVIARNNLLQEQDRNYKVVGKQVELII